VGYQRIYDNGVKKNQRDFSPNGGGFFQLGEVPPSPEGVEINLAESYSTSVSVRLGLEEKQPVFCAFNAGNLPALAKELRRQYPDYKIVHNVPSCLYWRQHELFSYQLNKIDWKIYIVL
jgi:phage/plasmid primase-like uncharacterized protein